MRAAIRLVKEGGADMVKLDGAAGFPEAVRAIARAGVPVWAQFGITPHTALQYGGMASAGPELATQMKDRLLEEAQAPRGGRRVAARLHELRAGGRARGRPRRRHSGHRRARRRAVARRPRPSAFAAIGYLAAALDDGVERYANVAQIALDAFEMFAEDVRAARQIRGAPRAAARTDRRPLRTEDAWRRRSSTASRHGTK